MKLNQFIHLSLSLNTYIYIYLYKQVLLTIDRYVLNAPVKCLSTMCDDKFNLLLPYKFLHFFRLSKFHNALFMGGNSLSFPQGEELSYLFYFVCIHIYLYIHLCVYNLFLPYKFVHFSVLSKSYNALFLGGNFLCFSQREYFSFFFIKSDPE